MPRFNNLGDLISRECDLGKTAIVDLGGEEVPREVLIPTPLYRKGDAVKELK